MDTSFSQPAGAVTVDQQLRETLQQSFSSIQPPAFAWDHLKYRIEHSHLKRIQKRSNLIHKKLPESNPI